MRRVIYLLAFIFLLSSCDTVLFLEPQPKKVKPLKEIPVELQGLYLDNNGDSLYIYEQSCTYMGGGLIDRTDFYLSDSVVLKTYRERYFINFLYRIGIEAYWDTYILESLDDGKQIDMYMMDPGDVVKLAKLQEITSKVRDIEDGESSYYLFDPSKRDYKKIIADTIFTKGYSYRKISSLK